MDNPQIKSNEKEINKWGRQDNFIMGQWNTFRVPENWVHFSQYYPPYWRQKKLKFLQKVEHLVYVFTYFKVFFEPKSDKQRYYQEGTWTCH